MPAPGASGFFRPVTAPAGTADFLYRLDEFTSAAERLDVVRIPDIIDVRDKRDVGVGAARYAEPVRDGFLELDEGVHVGAGRGEHVVAPEDHPHVEFAVAEYALHELEAGAVVEFFIDHRVPRDGDGPPAHGGLPEFFCNVFDLVDMHRLSISRKALSPVKEPAVVIVFKGGVRAVQQVGCILLDKSLLEPGVGAHERSGKRGIDLKGHFFEFDGGLVIFGLENPAFFQDHLHDQFVCPPDRRGPDDSHETRVGAGIIYVLQ